MKNKVVIITGASSGIGMACAWAFAKRGARVVLAARDTEKLVTLAQKLSDKGYESFALTTDVSVEEDCKQLIAKTINRYGRIDVMINNAGVSMRALFEELDLSVLKKLMDVNFWGAVYCTKYALPHLLQTKGSVLGISSIAGKKGLPCRTGYSASKFALEGFLETLRIENLKKGLHILVVCPGFTASNIRNTALIKDGTAQGESPREEAKMMQPDAVAEAIVDAVINRRRDLVLTFQGKLTVWLNKWFPAWTDQLVYNHMAKEPDSPLQKIN